MSYKFIFASLLSAACLYGSTNPNLQNIIILPNSKEMDAFGYNNCDMTTNGEVLLLDSIKIKGIAIDAGAHVGEWSKYVFDRNKKVHIFCFEPIPLFFEKTQNNLKNNSATIIQCALSNQNGRANFIYYPKHPGLSSLHRQPDHENTLNMDPVFLDVETKKLDLFCSQNNISNIRFLKIDTEGHELFVLLGAEELLKKGSIDLIQFEYGSCFPESKTTLKEIYDLLTKYDYEIFRITSFGLIQIDAWDDALENYNYANYLAAKKNG